MTNSTPGRSKQEIAIIGLSGRYPGGADTIAQLWNNLRSGVDGISEARGDRWDLGYHHPDPARPERIYTRAGGFLERIDTFDHEFFGLSPREVKQVDPQQRLLLELAWEALEDAALRLDKVAGSDTGVFIGISSNDYGALVGPGGPDAYSNTGSSFSIAANRVSYFLDLHGPSIALDTACSSSIVCVHQACLSLQASECSMALVGGVSLLVHVRPWLGFAKASMLSPTGRCKSFDAGGDGYVRSEGGGIVVLKPLEAAERDGDKIYGVIVGSGVNSDGHTLGLSMPNAEAQERLLRKVYTACEVSPEDVVYVEAHGTGTAVGDPIECESLGRVLGEPRQEGSHCLIGSVKSNIGHLEAASGMAGLTKALLVLQHKEIPGNLHFQTPNPKIRFDEWKLRVVTENTPLPQRTTPVVVGVNSFGFGGTNAHVAIREYRGNRLAAKPAPLSEWQNVLILSGGSPAALQAQATNYRSFLSQAPAAAWHDICAGSALGRSAFRYRLALAASNPEEAVAKLAKYLAAETQPGLATSASADSTASVAFVFSGNGPQWWGMGRELMAANAEFRREIERVDAVFQPLAGWSLVAEMQRPETESRMALTEYAQPLLFALQVALTALLRAAGIHPSATVGHSVGEVAAAYVSGALTLEQAARVIYFRSMQQARTAGMGQMAAIGVSAEEALDAMAQIPGWLELAASNAPKAVTVAGDPCALETLRDRMTRDGKFARILPLQYAFHTRAMDLIHEDLVAALSGLQTKASQIPFISTVDAGEKQGSDLGPNYWWRNVREPVRFHEAINHLLTVQKTSVFLEIGPHPVLRDYVLQCSKALDLNVAAFGTLRRPAANRSEPEVDNLWTAVCACHASGCTRLDELFTRPAVLPELPHYPFQRLQHWRGSVTLPDIHWIIARDHPLLGYRVPSNEGLWENTLDTNRLPFLIDHVVQDSAVFPAAGYVECALTAARLLFGEGVHDVESFDILRPLTIPPHTDPFIQLTADAKDGTFEISSRADRHAGEWTKNVRGRFSKADVSTTAPRFDIEALKATLPHFVEGASHYAAAERRGLSYGPAFQGVKSLVMSAPDAEQREALAEVHLPVLEGECLEPYRAHPTLTDSCVQVILSLIGLNERRNCAIIPVFIERVRSYAPVPNHLYCRVRLVSESDRSAQADFDLFDLNGQLIMSFLGTRCQKVDFKRGSASSLLTEWWRPDPKAASRFPAALDVLTFTTPVAAGEYDRPRFYRELLPAFNHLAGAYAAKALAEIGASHGAFNVARLMKRGRVKNSHERLLVSLIDMAESDGQLMADEKGWTWNDRHICETPEALWSSLLSRYPQCISELLLVARAGDHLGATLRGDHSAAENTSGLDALYERSCFQQVYNDLARQTLQNLIAAWPSNRPIRILEIGGGGGGLTAALLPILPPARTDYLFTDQSEAVIGRAQHRFGHDSFVRFAQLDLNQAFESQGQPADYFDIVIAGNALHSASHIHDTLVQLHSFLNAGGLLVALENHEQRFSTIVFGGDPAWWQVDDSDVRSHSRLLTVNAWQQSLQQAGFESPLVISDSNAVANDAPTQQSLFVARKPSSIEPTSGKTAHSEPDQSAASRKWLLLCDKNTEAVQTLISTLEARGQRVAIQVLSDSGSLTEQEAQALLKEFEPDSIVQFGAAGSPLPSHLPPDHRETRCLSALRLVQTIEKFQHEHPPQLTFVTQGALASPFAGPLNPGQAALWGLVRVVANEHPGLGCRLIDLYATEFTRESVAWLAEELLARDEETEVQLNDGLRYVNREALNSLGELAAASKQASPHAFRLDFLPQGGLDSLYLRAIERREPAAGQVEIRIHAAGLNFRDVLWAMGMLPEEAVEKGFSGPTIGMECAGEIVRVGAQSNFKVGDRVIALASSCFASHVTTDSGSVARIADSIQFEEAATIPITFLTAYYALDHLARLTAGETVLIHGAAGGVGLAAVQIAKLKGAKVIGTAGSPMKRRVLEMLGVDHVLNSRSLEFADEVMKLTDGVGVDVVLNSLAGEAITKGLQVLRPFGRFLEIGKRDLYANSRIGLRPFRQNLSYFGIDADTLLIERADLAKRLFQTVTDLFATGDLRPIPFQITPIARAAEAFRAMQQSRHVGKLVISVDLRDTSHLPIVRTKTPVDSHGTYLVTGGLGGFGLTTAQWLVAEGARSIALIGRRGAVTEEAKDGIAAMEKTGAIVRAFAADVADPASVSAVVSAIRQQMAPLCGVIHSAAVIEDAPVLNVTEDLLARVLNPKMVGAWNLHQATLQDKLEMFILYSSSSVMVGNPGQSAYVAANLSLESLAQYRRSLGLPGLAVGWGAIKDAGFLTRHTNVAEMLKNRSGLDATPAAEALAELARLVAVDATRVCIARFNLQRLGQMLAGARIPRFLPIIPQGMSAEEANSESLAALLKATDSGDRPTLVISHIREHAARILGTSAGQLDVERSLSEMGLDSLMAVELAEAVERDVERPISVMQMLSAGTITAIADLVLRTLGLSDTGATTDNQKTPADAARNEGPGQARTTVLEDVAAAKS